MSLMLVLTSTPIVNTLGSARAHYPWSQSLVVESSRNAHVAIYLLRWGQAAQIRWYPEIAHGQDSAYGYPSCTALLASASIGIRFKTREAILRPLLVNFNRICILFGFYTAYNATISHSCFDVNYCSLVLTAGPTFYIAIVDNQTDGGKFSGPRLSDMECERQSYRKYLLSIDHVQKLLYHRVDTLTPQMTTAVSMLPPQTDKGFKGSFFPPEKGVGILVPLPSRQPQNSSSSSLPTEAEEGLSCLALWTRPPLGSALCRVVFPSGAQWELEAGDWPIAVYSSVVKLILVYITLFPP
ncbi:hypothetical protein EDB84DRAFT_1440410 [Lactarius hengduanensis]|nr:hypothetical protein EDB84DRAFT_1440410 [Lactarius hengduanensis]